MNNAEDFTDFSRVQVVTNSKEDIDHECELQIYPNLTAIYLNSVEVNYFNENHDANPIVDTNFQIADNPTLSMTNDKDNEPKKSQNKFECNNCEKQFSFKVVLKKHLMKNFMFVTHLMCNFCDKRFWYKCEFKRHIKAKHKFHVCEICKKKFKPGSTKLDICKKCSMKDKLLCCKYCDMKFHQRVLFETHIKSHKNPKPYQCDLCSQYFSNLQHVKRHIEVIHNGETNFQCEYCKKCFRWDSSLRTHLKTHTNERPHQCSCCSYSFRRSCDLKRHMITHTNEKNFSCQHCDKKFTRNSSLQRHIRAHFGEKPYLCNVCGKRFNESFFLKEHMESHSENRLYYHCDRCDKRFNNRRVLRVHAKKHNNEGTEVEFNVTKQIGSFEEPLDIAEKLPFFNYLKTEES